MIIKVHMLAFCDKGTVREVSVYSLRKKHSTQEGLENTLESIFHYGQNDNQQREQPSVSSRDVIEWYGEYYDIEPIGFKKLSKKKFEALKGHRVRNGEF